MPKCCKCGIEKEYHSLYCEKSGRGANSNCAFHGDSDLYCDGCYEKFIKIVDGEKVC